MPRYCAVKACKNRGGTASKDNKRISFYPFPLQDEARLQRWVDNMRREEWTPSRHQYLCSEHFTHDCFDVRWGIRYLKNTAIPTIFPSSQGVREGRSSSKKALKPRTRPCNSDIRPAEPDTPPNKRPVILSRRRTRTADLSDDTPSPPITVVNQSTVPTISELKLSSTPSQFALGEVMPLDTHMEVFGSPSQVSRDSVGSLRVSCSALSGPTETQQLDSTTTELTVLCCKSPGPLSDRRALPTALEGQMYRIVPEEPEGEGQTDDPIRNWELPSEGEHMCAYEHSYSRPDTDQEQLWSRIMSLHAKIVELDRREESAVAKIRALESEIAHLKRDSVVFSEKQRILEDYISSVLL